MPWGSCPNLAGGRHPCPGSVLGRQPAVRSGQVRPRHRGSCECDGQLGHSAPGNPRREQRGDGVPWVCESRPSEKSACSKRDRNAKVLVSLAVWRGRRTAAGCGPPASRSSPHSGHATTADRSWTQPQASLHPAIPITPPSRPSHTTLSLHDLMEGTVMSIIEDIQRRSAHIHWPQGIVPEQADGDGVQVLDAGLLRRVAGVFGGLPGFQALKGDALLAEQPPQALVADVVDHPLSDQELGQLGQAPGGKRQVMVSGPELGQLFDLPPLGEGELRRAGRLCTWGTAIRTRQR